MSPSHFYYLSQQNFSSLTLTSPPLTLPQPWHENTFAQGHQWCPMFASNQWPSLGSWPWPLSQQHWTLLTTLSWSNLFSASLSSQAPKSSLTSTAPPYPPDLFLPTYFKVISSHFWLQMTTYMLMIGFKVITLSSELQTPSSRTSTTDLTQQNRFPFSHLTKKLSSVHKPSQEKVP